MTGQPEGARPCPLCKGFALTPVFYPPLVRCSECGLVFRNLGGLQERVREGFNTIYAQPAVEQWVQDRRVLLYRQFLARHPPAPGRNRLLDVGCGAGHFLALARERGWDVTGVEIAEAGAEAARAAGLPVLVASLPSAALPESSFDLVTFWNLLDCVPDPLEQVRAAKRLLAPGGRLFVRVNNVTLHAALYRFSRLLRPRPGDRLLKPYIFNQISFSARTLRRTLEQAGFPRIEVGNSPPVYGDPYRVIAGGGDRLVQVLKRSVHGLAWVVATMTGGRLLWASSLMAEAVNDGRDAGRGNREA